MQEKELLSQQGQTVWPLDCHVLILAWTDTANARKKEISFAQTCDQCAKVRRDWPLVTIATAEAAAKGVTLLL